MEPVDYKDILAKLSGEMSGLIGLHGIAENNGERIGSKFVGKDTVANCIVKMFQYRKDSFAEPMYQMLSSLYGIYVNPESLTVEEKDNKIQEPWGKTIRVMLQEIGGALRAVDEDVFVKSLLHRLDKALKVAPKYSYCGTVISDVRMDNEARAIRERGGVIIHVHREMPLEDYPVQSTVTEQGVEIMPEDLHFYNDSPLDLLEYHVARLMICPEIHQQRK